jgi:hypothetical protein
LYPKIYNTTSLASYIIKKSLPGYKPESGYHIASIKKSGRWDLNPGTLAPHAVMLAWGARVFH